jgi:pSer/pThr/pTyr-binding forkhead associated (FHA) protein
LSLLLPALSLLLSAEDDRILITDLNSTNGTVVDGQELSPMDDATVTVGSEVIFGECWHAGVL